MADDPPQQASSQKPFPREAYIFGWLVICVVVAEGIHNLVTGVYGSGILLLCVVPFMLWVMYVRPRRHGGRQRGS